MNSNCDSNGRPLNAEYVTGWEIILDGFCNLYAVFHDGRVVHRVSRDFTCFDRHNVVWTIVPALPAGLKYVGCYNPLPETRIRRVL